jgi:hypothetical protein
MKTITKTEPIKAAIKVVTYKCDHCEFTDDRSWKVERHEATHLDIVTRTHGGFQFYLANDKNSLCKYIWGHHHGADVDITWDGPGWYCISGSYEDSYGDTTLYVKKAKKHLEEEADNARRLLKQIEEIDELKILSEG